MKLLKRKFVGILCLAVAVSAFSQTPVQKQLYLSDPLQGLDRIDPVVTLDGTTATSGILSTTPTGIVLDSTSTGSTTSGSSITIAHTTGTGMDRLMMVGVSFQDRGGDHITSVTYGGTSLIRQGIRVNTADPDHGQVEIYSLINPPSGSANVVVTFASYLEQGGVVGVSTFSGVLQTGTFGTFKGSSGESHSPSLTGVVSAPGEVVFDVLSARRSSSAIPGAGQSELWDRDSGDQAQGSASTKAGASTVNMTWYTTSDEEWALGAISFRPAPIVATVTFTQSPVFCSDLVIKAGAVVVSNYISLVSGTMPASPDVTATIKYGSTTIITLTNPSYHSGTALLTWTGTLGADVTVPAGQAIVLEITTAEAGVRFTIDYDSQSKPSKIEFLTSTYIDIDGIEIYTAAYPDGAMVSQVVDGETYYVRVAVSDPFGHGDVNGVDLSITDDLSNSNSVVLGSSEVVYINGCQKIYEHAFAAASPATLYSFFAVAHEGYEGAVTDSSTLNNLPVIDIDAIDDAMTVESGSPGSLNVLANDLGDLDPESLSIVLHPQNGSLQVATNGVISYLPSGNFAGTDQYTYSICNNDPVPQCDVAVVTVTVETDFTNPCIEAVEAKTFYMPYPENDTQLGDALFQASRNSQKYTGVMRNVISIKHPYPGVVITYDEWEDGYENDITIPLQSTTKIWGDGDLSNGVAPGYPADILPAGSSIILDNKFIYSPRNPANIYFDGKDKIYTTGDVAISKVTGDDALFSVQSAKTTVVDTSRYGTLFTLGLGEIVGVPYFSYGSLFIAAATDGTVVSIDLDADGNVDLTHSLDEGEVWFYQGNPAATAIATAIDIKPGTIITANKPVGVDLLFGGNDNYGTRNINVLPGKFYGDTYYTPVPTTHAAAPTVVYFVNSLATPITVNWKSGTGSPSSGSVTVAANSYNSMTLWNHSAYKFWSSGGESFIAVQIMDADNIGSRHDWAITLIGADRLTDFTSIAWAPGSLDGSRNDNPIWVTPTSNTTLYIKYDGNLMDTSSSVSPCGLPYDDSVTLNEFDYYQVKDSSDNDQSGVALFTCDGTTFVAVYGEDAATALTGAPSLDVGTILAPMCLKLHVNAVYDRRVTQPETPVMIDVSDNDTSFLCTIDPLSVSTTGLLQPANGSVVVGVHGNIQYTPDPGFSGEDVFEYRICSLEYPGVCDVAKVYVIVTYCNATPDEILIGGKVFLELLPDNGAYDVGESFVEGVQVDLHSDANCNGIVDSGDLAFQSTLTDAFGNYEFSSINGYFAKDDFDPVASFSGNDGGVNWDNNWVEQSDNGVIDSGDVRIMSDLTTGNNAIRIGRANNGISRSLTFSGATDATLQFSYRRQNLDDSGEELVVQVNGTTVYTVDDGGAVGTDSFYHNVSLTLSSAIYNANGLNTLLFINNGNPGTTDYFWIDDVKMTYVVAPVCLIARVNTSVSGGSYSNALLSQAAFSFSGTGVCTNNNYLGVTANLRLTDDHAVTAIDIPVQIGVLANDVVGKPDPSTVTTNGMSNQPANGTVTINPDGTITYTPNPGFTGVDNFEYKACSLEDPSLCDIALVTVTVSCVSLSGQNTIVGLVFNDFNGDGTLDSGEGGMSGWLVHLYKDINGDGILDATDPLLDSEVTSELGGYQFDVIPPVTINTYLDQFNVNGHPSGSDGTTPWTTSWSEIGESDGFDDGDIRITSNSLRVRDNDNGGEGAYRITNIDGATSATLSFGYSEHSLDNANDYVTVSVSTDGSSWNNLVAYSGADGNQNGSASFDISTHISATTYVRFLGSSHLGGSDYILFDNVQISYTTYSPADYIVQLDQPLPVGYVLTTPLPSPDGIQTASFTGVGEGDCENNFGLLAPVTIGDYVWLDENSDGYQDAGESGIANVMVMAFNTATGATYTNWTDSSGTYLFADLLSGEYTVVVNTASLPAGLSANPTYDLDGTLNNATTVTLAAGDELDTVDFGYNWVPPTDTSGNTGTGAIGDRLWVDADGDGVQDLDEIGLSGVEVKLYSDPDGDGVYDNIVDTTTTDTTGNYIFDGLTSDAYVVEVNGGTTPAGYTQTGDPDGTLDNASEPIILAPGDVYLNADFGYEPTTEYEIGDKIYLDMNASGTWDMGESGIGGVSMALIADIDGDGVWEPLGADGVAGTSDDESIIATAITTALGLYSFEGLPPDDYIVRVSDTGDILGGYDQSGDPDSIKDGTSALTISTADNFDQDFGYVPEGHSAGKGMIGDTIFLDRDYDGSPDTGEGLEGVIVTLYNSAGTAVATTVTDSIGKYLFGGVSDGNYTIKVEASTLPDGVTNTTDPDGSTANESSVTISGGTIDLDQDFGYRGTGNYNTIGGTIWEDVDADGTLKAGEVNRFAGVILSLLTINGNVVATTTADANGDYSFAGLPDGIYTVDVTDKGNKLNGYWHSDGQNDDADNNSQSDPYTVSVTGGETDTTGDFGYYETMAALGNFVWDDINGDGIQSSGEPGISNAFVKLTIIYPDFTAVSVVTKTDAAGHYAFDSLLLDENYGTGGVGPVYEVAVTLPAEYQPTLIGKGDGANDSDNPAGVTTAAPVRGTIDNGYDFGGVIPAEIFGYLFEDEDGNLLRNSGDTSITNAFVTLIVNGVTVATTNTDEWGYYFFGDIPIGTATILVSQVDANLIAVPVTTDETRNRALSNDVSTAYIEYSVISGYGVLAAGEQLNFGFDTHPLSTQISIKVYTAADGRVMIEISTVNEGGSADIEIYAMIDGVWVEVARVSGEDVVGFGSNTYTVEATGLIAGQSYLFKIVDEAGHTFESELIEVARSPILVGAVTLTPEFMTLTFSTEYGQLYLIKVSESLGAAAQWNTEYVSSPTAAGWSDYLNEAFMAGPGTTTQVRIPRNRTKAFFKAVQVQ